MSIKDLLFEYSGDSDFESYTGIVLDKENNAFKVIKGMFRDKKDFYEKMHKQGYILRKCFETDIFEWIERNAEDDLTTYLMFSTAFSKWRGNNVLSDYYVKLLNDIPHLNRETQKGNPKSKGKEQGGWNESVLEDGPIKEAFDTEALANRAAAYRSLPDVDKHTISIYPVGYSGEIINSAKARPIVLDAWYPFDAEGKDKFKDPLFLRQLYVQLNQPNYASQKFPSFAFIVDGNYSNPTYMTYRDISSAYNTITKNPNWKLADKNTAINQLNKKIKDIDTKLNPETKGYADLSQDEKDQLFFDRDTLKQQRASVGRDAVDNTKYTKQEREALKDLTDNLRRYQSNPGDEDLAKFIQDEIKNIKDTASKRTAIMSPAKTAKRQVLDRYDDLTHGLAINANPVPSNPMHGGDSEGTFLKRLDKKRSDAEKLKLLRKKFDLNEPVKIKRVDNFVLPKDMATKADELSKQNTKDFFKGIQPLKNQEPAPYDIVNTLTKTKQYTHGNISDKDMDSLVLDIFKTYTKDQNIDAQSVRKYFIENPKVYMKELDNRLARFDKGERFGKEAPQEESAPVNAGVNTLYADEIAQGKTPFRGALPLGGTITEDYTHSELNTNLFDGDKLKPEVRAALLEIANKFEESLELPVKPVDIYFTGSCANYNYNDKSDIDLHLVYDFEKVGLHAEIVANYMKASKKIFNKNYDITIKGIPVEVGCENTAEPVVATAVYSILNDEWIKKPEDANKEYPGVDLPIYNELTLQIEDAIESQDSSVIGNLWKMLGKLRKDSLAQEGEFGVGNAIFKKLRNMEYLNRLKDAYYASASKELSLEALEDII